MNPRRKRPVHPVGDLPRRGGLPREARAAASGGAEPRRSPRTPGPAGAGTVEILVASAAALLVLASSAQTVVAQHELRRLEDSRAALREGARRVTGTIAREVRTAGFDPLTVGPFDGSLDGVTVAAPEAIEVLADRGDALSGSAPDGVADPASDERIGFYRSVAQRSVHQTIGGFVAPMLDGPEVPPGGLAFRYFDACGDELVPAASTGLDAGERARIARIDVRLALVDPPTGSRMESGTTVALRNRQELPCR